MAALAGLIAMFATASSAGAAPAAVPEVKLVVKLAPTQGERASSVLLGLPGSTPNGLAGDRYTLTIPAGEVAATLAQLRARPGVLFAAQVHKIHATALPSRPNDPCYTGSCLAYQDGDTTTLVSATQSDLAQVHAPAAWAITHGSAAGKVVVLDTGVDLDNTDLGPNITIGPDLCAGGPTTTCGPVTATDSDVPPAPGPGVYNESGHGTHVTGTIAATTGNGQGVASLGWDTPVEVIKVLDGTGSGDSSTLATGIYDAVAAGAKVISMSLGNSPCSVDPNNCGPDPDTQAAVEYAQAHNVVVVAAAGNDYSTEPTYPAGYAGVLSVASVDGTNITSSFSEYGSAANISAPGEEIVSTWNTGPTALSTLTGTSMATPHVAAAAAMVLAAAPGLAATLVTSILRETASPETGHSIDGGVLNAGLAVQTAAGSRGVYEGYHLAGSDGSVYSFGAAPTFGSLAGQPLNRPIVTVADRRDHTGYWLAASDGGIFTFGSAGYYGSTGDIRLNQPIVGMAPTKDGGGYWLVAADGGIFTFGDAAYHGSTGNIRLNQPIVGMAATASNGGYWLVARDGGIFTFGNATYHGSTGNVRLNQPIVGMSATTDGGGYWLAAADGGMFPFGDANFEGSAGGQKIPAPVISVS